MNKFDILVSFIIAEIDAWLIIGISNYIGWNFVSLIKFLPLILPVLVIFGFLITKLLSQKIFLAFQFYKFSLVGTLSAFIDLGILNLLMWSSGITYGLFYPVFKSVSFVTATCNSYFWNKFWTFQKREVKNTFKEFIQFLMIAITGLLIHISVASLIVNVFGPKFGIRFKLWANIGATIAILLGSLWNFYGYKFLVFKAH